VATRASGVAARPSLAWGSSSTGSAATNCFNPALLRHSLAAKTIDQLPFSTDHPFQRPTQPEIQQFLAEFDNDEDREKFTGGNARRLFGIDATHE
jgi:predicted TIM-barrel fold metal-dependent hydrolase